MTNTDNEIQVTKKYKSQSWDDKLNRHIKNINSLDRSFTIITGAIARIQRNTDEYDGSQNEEAKCAVYERMLKCVKYLSAAFTFIVKHSDECNTGELEDAYMKKVKEFKVLMAEVVKLGA